MVLEEIKLEQIRHTITAKLALLEQVEKEKAKTEKEMQEELEKGKAYTEATQLLRDLYEQTQERFHGQIVEVVSHCLRSVFGNDAYEFKINFAQKRNQVEASFVFVKDGEEYDPLTMTGGGVLAVACFALRMVVIYLTRRSVRPIMIMDEPFSQLSVEYREPMVALLDQLAHDYNFQFIIITHATEFELGKVYTISKH